MIEIKTVSDLAEARIAARNHRGPWPSQEAIEHGARECLEEIADAYSFAVVKKQMADTLISTTTKHTEWVGQNYRSIRYDHVIYHLQSAFAYAAAANPEVLTDAFRMAGVEVATATGKQKDTIR